MKHYLIVGIQVIVSLLLGSLLAHAQGQLDLMYSPMVLELAGDRGNSVPFEITIINQSRSATAYFRSEVTGLYERPDGVYVPRDRSDWTYDASEWVELDATEFSVPPGGFYVIRGRVRIPRQTAASGYAMVVTELLPEPAPPGVEASTEYYQRFTTALEVAVGRQQRRSAYIAEMKVIPTGSSPDLALAYGRNGLLFLATLANDGDIHVRAQGQLIIRDAAGRRVRTVPLGTGRGVVIPDSVIELGSVIMSLPPGEYEAEARINYGGHRPAIARAAFTIDDAAAGISGIVAGRTMRVDVMPALIELVMPRHGYRAGTITVSNLDSTDVRFNVYVEELLHDLDRSARSGRRGHRASILRQRVGNYSSRRVRAQTRAAPQRGRRLPGTRGYGRRPVRSHSGRGRARRRRGRKRRLHLDRPGRRGVPDDRPKPRAAARGHRFHLAAGAGRAHRHVANLVGTQEPCTRR